MSNKIIIQWFWFDVTTRAREIGNKLEELLLTAADLVAPIKSFYDNVTSSNQPNPSIIKKKLTNRKKLLAKLRQNPNEELKGRLMNLNKEIKDHYKSTKRKRVRKE